MFRHLIPFVFACESDSGVFINTLCYSLLQSEGQNTENYVKVRDIVNAKLEVYFCLTLEQYGAVGSKLSTFQDMWATLYFWLHASC